MTKLDCLEAVDYIELAVDQDLDDVRNEHLQSHLAGCAECAAKLEDAVAIRTAFENVTMPECPKNVVDAILAQTVDTPAQVLRRAPSPLLRRVPWLRSVGAVAAIVALMALVVPQTLNRSSDQPSVEEVFLATEQVRFAFAVLSKEMNRTSDLIGIEIGRQFSGPLRDGLGHIGSAIPEREAKEDRQGSLSIPPRNEQPLLRDIIPERT